MVSVGCNYTVCFELKHLIKEQIDMALFTHNSGNYLIREDANIYYEVTGNPAGFPLILLHGGMGNLTDFNAILGSLVNDFKLIGLDFRGHGKSSLGTKALSYQTYQEDVEFLLDHLNIAHFGIMGFSDGGITAYRIASHKTSEKASQVKVLVAIAAHQQIHKNDFCFPFLANMTGPKWRAKFPVSTAYYDRINPEPDFDHLVEQAVKLWTSGKGSQYPNKAVKQIKAPCLLVRGEEDHLFSEIEMSKLNSLIKGSQMASIATAGHEAYQDNPYVFTQKVKLFLLEVLSSEIRLAPAISNEVKQLSEEQQSEKKQSEKEPVC